MEIYKYMMNNLRQLINRLEYIDQGGELIRELDYTTGRIISKPVTEGEIGRKIGSAIGGIFGKDSADRLGQIGSNIGDIFDKPDSSKSSSSKSRSNKSEPASISDFSSGPAGPGKPSSETNSDSISTFSPSSEGRNADGSYNSDHPFVKMMNAKMAAGKNPNSNGGHEGSGISPNDDPEDPKTWPPGVKAAPDFGYLDPNGMWVPTPFHVRTESGNWKPPRTSPANLVGIPHNIYTPFQLKIEKMTHKVAYNNASLIEQSKPVKLPDGAPELPGYKQVDPGRFGTSTGSPIGPSDLHWVYAYQKGKDFILIAPELYYNMKISIGRHYPSWVGGGISSDNDRVPSVNGPVYVSGANFNVNDMILAISVHTSIGAGNIGPNVLRMIAKSLNPA